MQFGDSFHEIAIPHVTRLNFRQNENWLAEQQRFLPAIALLGESGSLSLFTSTELQRETWQHKPSKYTGSIYGSSLFAAGWVKSLPSPTKRNVSRIMTDYDWTTAEQRDFFRTIDDYQFCELAELLGDKHISDAFHVWTAHKNYCHTFLTVDKKLIKMISSLKGQGKIGWLKTQVQCPEDFSRRIGARPVNIEHLLYTDPLVPIFNS